MQCNTNYTSNNSNYKNLNLNVLETYKKKFGIILGLSDHTNDEISTLCSIALGAKVIEKHFLDHNDPSNDEVSLNINSWPEMINKKQDF